MMWPFRKRCLHEWKVLDKTEFPSAWERMNKSGEVGSLTEVPAWLFESKVVLALACTKCGELKQTEHDSP